MVEEKPRVQKVLEFLYEVDKPVKPKEIGDQIGEGAMNIGKDLYDLSKRRGLAVKLDDGSWEITTGGRDYVESGGQPKAEPTAETKAESIAESAAESAAEPKAEPKAEPTEVGEAVPSQADLFTGIGERLGVGGRKGDVKLEAIIYYVQRTADLDNLSSVWNALTEMGVANDVKKRWIKLSAQNLPGKEIPKELKEKLEEGLEPEKVKGEAGEIPPKPNRFSVVGGEIIGDPEGDYNFKEALQYFAQQRGVQDEPVKIVPGHHALKQLPGSVYLPLLIPQHRRGLPEVAGEGDELNTIHIIRDNRPLAAIGSGIQPPVRQLLQTKRLAAGWRGDIRVQVANAEAESLEAASQVGGDHRLSYTNLDRSHHDFPHLSPWPKKKGQALSCLPRFL